MIAASIFFIQKCAISHRKDANTMAQYKRIVLSEIQNRMTKNISTEQSLKNVTPMKWSGDVLSGKKNAIISKSK